ncbi:quinolinate synthetase [Nitrococcus mobilis Nb-231]|uniref:Quinolinate synthetase n=2 Tax=Nitrococcus mobilis TaxID=35797 RepID=A4BUT9_9GAMM|nr:quinolinate synthetase [Nitrococcus mobilis Nb-231]
MGAPIGSEGRVFCDYVVMDAMAGQFQLVPGGAPLNPYESLGKCNFRKRLQALGCIEATDEMSRPGGHRPPRLYRGRQFNRLRFIKQGPRSSVSSRVATEVKAI